MKRSIGLWQLMGFAVTSLLGTILHFLYDWLGGAVWIAPFSGVNESTWEHMKLLFWPMLLYAALQSLFFRDRADFFCIKRDGILLGLALIPLLFYGYNGIIGESPDAINIAIFFVAAAVAYLYEARRLRSAADACQKPKRALATLLVIGAFFILFTFKAPTLALFRDPLLGTYGIPG